MAKSTEVTLAEIKLLKHDGGTTNGADMLPSGQMKYSLLVFLRNFA